jgi:DNA-directed RNA polymerase subunit RPC12/RpoP
MRLRAQYKCMKCGAVFIERRRTLESLPRRKTIAGHRCRRIGGVTLEKGKT